METRADEMAALAETIKILNDDDDALELFKKTLTSASSFVQVGVEAVTMRRNILASLHQGVKKALKIDFTTLALHGNKITFDKVIKMIDAMVETLKKEQKNDDYKKEYCTMQLDLKDDEGSSISCTI